MTFNHAEHEWLLTHGRTGRCDTCRYQPKQCRVPGSQPPGPPYRPIEPQGPCGYCTVLSRPCACRRPVPARQPRCAERGEHIVTASSANCVECGARV